ncbi:MAG: DNA-binding response regulator, partial [Ectothiorhodospiraceae bacterium]|nr:DNA-binding response regulator [Ectothiorhodospiraceae bacterium]
DLNKLVADGNFREDLLFRLRVFDIQVAPLRARKEDIRMLARHFLNRNAKLIGKSIEGISEEAMEILLHHEYPGNVRELENIIRKAAILTSGKAIVPSDIALKKEAVEDDEEGDFAFPFFTTNFIQAREYFTAEFESQYVNTILKKYKGNISVAAANCGMTRQNMQRLIHKHKIDVEYYRNI